MRWCRSPCCPIIIFTLVRQSAGENGAWRRFGRQALALVLAVGAIVSAGAIATEHYFPLGRVDRATYLMWDDIGRNTRYQDVVVSPVLEANPISAQVGASYKLVHLAKDFAEVDKLVDHVCGEFNVVLALPEGTDAGAFAAPPTDRGRSTPGEFGCCGLRTIGVIGSAAPRLGITSAHVWHRRHLSSRRA